MHLQPCAFLLTAMLFASTAADVWVKVNVKKIQIARHCVEADNEDVWSAGGCLKSLSHTTLEERMLPWHEQRATSFEHVEGVTHSVVSHWRGGAIGDWMMAVQFMAVDPVYGIARTCDRSGFVRVFQNSQNPSEPSDVGVASNNNNSINADEAYMERTIKVQGQCFTATLLVQAHRDMCPWCNDEAHMDSKDALAFGSSVAMVPNLLLVIVLLVVVSMVAVCATGVFLVLYLVEKRRSPIIPIYELPAPETSWKRPLMSSLPSKATDRSWLTSSSMTTTGSWRDLHSNIGLARQPATMTPTPSTSTPRLQKSRIGGGPSALLQDTMAIYHEIEQSRPHSVHL